jgi:hypothetical protein
MLVTLRVTKEFLKLIKWINSGTSTDSSRLVTQYFKVKSPEIVATNGYVIFKATFDSSDKLSAIIEDGFYKLLILQKDILVLDKTEDEINFVPYEKAWRNPDQIRTDPIFIAEGEYRINANLCFNTRFVADAISLMGDNRSKRYEHSCEIVIGSHVRQFYLGMKDFTYFVQKTPELYAKLEAILMPMHNGLVRSIDLQRHEQKKVEVEEIPAEVMA